MQSFEYKEPSTLAEASRLLEELGKSAVILAGGTDLINQIHSGKRSPKLVMQIRKIAELSTKIEVQETGLKVGATTSLDEIANSHFIMERFTALAEAARNVGSKQIRNRGTLIGNICNASPAADTVPALLIYDAVVNIVGGKEKSRSICLDSFITGPGTTGLRQGEIVESVFIAYPIEGSKSVYLKLSRRDGVDLATVGVAVYFDGTSNVRLALGAVGPRAFRAYDAEKTLSQINLDDETINIGVEQAVKAASPISDIRGSREYRLAMIEVLAQRGIKKVTQICARKVE